MNDGDARRLPCLVRMLQRDAEEAEGLRTVMSRIDQFFVEAAAAPSAVCIERSSDPQEERDLDMSEREVHMSIVAGVLEQRDKAPVRQVSGITLPTEENLALLEAEKMRDSQALLHLFSALVNPACGNMARKPTNNDDAASSSSSECVYMNASSCDESDGSEAPPPAKKRLITELS